MPTSSSNHTTLSTTVTGVGTEMLPGSNNRYMGERRTDPCPCEARDDYQLDVVITRHVGSGGKMTHGYLDDGLVTKEDQASDEEEDDDDDDGFVVPEGFEDDEEDDDEQEDVYEHPMGVYNYLLQQDNLYHCTVKHCGDEYIVVYSDWYSDCLSSSRGYNPEYLECETEWRRHSIGTLTDIILPKPTDPVGEDIKGTFIEKQTKKVDFEGFKWNSK